MKLRCFKNSTELANGQVLEMVQIYKYWPQTFDYPEEWEGDEPVFYINGEPVDREKVFTTLSTEEFEKFVDSAVEDKNWSPPGPDAVDYL